VRQMGRSDSGDEGTRKGHPPSRPCRERHTVRRQSSKRMWRAANVLSTSALPRKRGPTRGSACAGVARVAHVNRYALRVWCRESVQCLLRSQPAIDTQRPPRDERRTVRQQEQRGLRDFFRFRGAAHRMNRRRRKRGRPDDERNLFINYYCHVKMRTRNSSGSGEHASRIERTGGEKP